MDDTVFLRRFGLGETVCDWIYYKRTMEPIRGPPTLGCLLALGKFQTLRDRLYPTTCDFPYVDEFSILPYSRYPVGSSLGIHRAGCQGTLVSAFVRGEETCFLSVRIDGFAFAQSRILPLKTLLHWTSVIKFPGGVPDIEFVRDLALRNSRLDYQCATQLIRSQNRSGESYYSVLKDVIPTHLRERYFEFS